MSAAQVASQSCTYDAQRLDLGSALKWYVKQQLRVIFVALQWDIRWIQPFIPCPEDTLGRVFRRLIQTPHLRSSIFQLQISCQMARMYSDLRAIAACAGANNEHVRSRRLTCGRSMCLCRLHAGPQLASSQS
jgi:hypothetical protein